MTRASCRFGSFVIDREGYRVLRGDEPLDFSPKLIDLLMYLIDHRGALATKESLLEALWPGANVTENALAQAISDLRQALDDDAHQPRYIKTVARRGYRFIAPVEEIDSTLGHTPSARPGARETSSLDAYRAFTGGWLKIESLDTRELRPAIEDFERAVSFDPGYALAYTGLANAKYALYQTTRAENQPAEAMLSEAIEHARRSIDLDAGLAEAHATLSMVLVAAWKTPEALIAARRAVALEPSHWRHLFRLGHASWGDARIQAASNTLALYPDFAFAYFQMAMVHVARAHLSQADTVLLQGIAMQDRQVSRRERFPALGLHWLRGLIRLAQDDVNDALAEFGREVAITDPCRVYGPEYAMTALHGRGCALLRAGQYDDAVHAFRQALEIFPEHAPSHIGVAQALKYRGLKADAEAHLKRTDSALETLARHRPIEAAMVRAQRLTTEGRSGDALDVLAALISTAPPGFAGWTIPVEPLLTQLQTDQRFAVILGRLAERAR